jgi:hypothetical protein
MSAKSKFLEIVFLSPVKKRSVKFKATNKVNRYWYKKKAWQLAQNFAVKKH